MDKAAEYSEISSVKRKKLSYFGHIVRKSSPCSENHDDDDDDDNNNKKNICIAP